jgi:2-phosphosulfolactate phosphatase
MNEKYTVETCFSPALFPYRMTTENYVVVIVDILRATTSVNAAFDNGVEAIIPVAEVEKARKYKHEGFLVASEREGKTLDFADFGNSAFNFMTPEVRGKTLVYSTTNGTQAIEMAVSNGADAVIGSFNNLEALARWIEKQEQNVLILCSGFKNKFCIEDAFFAGALAERLLDNHSRYASVCDSVTVSLDMWRQ